MYHVGRTWTSISKCLSPSPHGDRKSPGYLCLSLFSVPPTIHTTWRFLWLHRATEGIRWMWLVDTHCSDEDTQHGSYQSPWHLRMAHVVESRSMAQQPLSIDHVTTAFGLGAAPGSLAQKPQGWQSAVVPLLSQEKEAFSWMMSRWQTSKNQKRHAPGGLWGTKAGKITPGRTVSWALLGWVPKE
jgi:hypothetical protein